MAMKMSTEFIGGALHVISRQLTRPSPTRAVATGTLILVDYLTYLATRRDKRYHRPRATGNAGYPFARINTLLPPMDPNIALELNGGDDEDEALRRAIAMSMGEDADALSTSQSAESADSGSRKQAQVVDLTGSPEPELKPALEQSVSASSNSLAIPASANTSASIFGFDRKKMEEERLARLNKRKAAEAGADSDHRPQQRPRLLDGRPVASVASLGKPPTGSTGASANTLRFPKGVVKRTWLKGQPRHTEDITIEEVLQKDTLEVAVLSSFQWNYDWLFTKINMSKTKTTLVAFAGSEADQAEVAKSLQGIARVCFPPMNGVGSMHSKLQILKFPTYLRVVVPSGNLVSFDWGETGTLENTVFIIDLPLLGSTVGPDQGTWTPFAEELVYFLKAQHLAESLIGSLRKYDFSETSRYAFVHTIAGSHAGDSWKRTGYCGLGKAVTALGLATNEPLEIDFVASSIGSLNYPFLTALYNACQGDSGIKEYDSRTAKSQGNKDDIAVAHRAKLKQQFRIYFPSESTVGSSRGGTHSAGTICLQTKWWNSAMFPRELFRDYRNPRGALVHSKIMFVTPAHGSAAWAYVGSANISESAWGKLTKDRSSSQLKISCRNWECGVIVPAEQGLGRVLSTGLSRMQAQSQQAADGDVDGVRDRVGGRPAAAGQRDSLVDVFRDCVPLPMEVPGTSYVSGDGKAVLQPWLMRWGQS